MQKIIHHHHFAVAVCTVSSHNPRPQYLWYGEAAPFTSIDNDVHNTHENEGRQVATHSCGRRTSQVKTHRGNVFTSKFNYTHPVRSQVLRFFDPAHSQHTPTGLAKRSQIGFKLSCIFRVLWFSRNIGRIRKKKSYNPFFGKKYVPSNFQRLYKCLKIAEMSRIQ